MAETVYKTSDGQIHDSRLVAEAHQRVIDSRNTGSLGNTLGNLTDHQKTTYKNDDAEKLFKQGDYDGAISKVNEGLLFNKRSPRSYNILANAYNEKGDYDKAIDYFTCTLSEISYEREARASLFNNRGLAYKAKGDKENAVKDFKHAADFGFSGALTNLKNMGIQYTPKDRENDDWSEWHDSFSNENKATVMRIMFGNNSNT